MTSFRFIHAADIHLDSPLRGLVADDAQVGERVRTATRQAFRALIALAIEEKVSFVIIAGDLYDGEWRDYQTGLFFVAQMGKLSRAGIPAFLLYGNHDAESQITKKLVLPDSVTVFSARSAKTHVLKEVGVALHGQSFKTRDVSDNLVLGYPAAVDKMFNIGVLHTAMGGNANHANYAPCSLEDLKNKGYDYWALGHVHQHEVLHERPHVVFPGVLQGRHIRETGPKGACLITVEDGEVMQVAPLLVDVVRWALVSVDVTGCEKTYEVTDRVKVAMERAVEQQADGRMLACRVALRGRTAISAQLSGSRAELLEDIRAVALGLGEEVAWVEKVAMSFEPMSDSATFAAREDAVGELQSMLAHAGDDPTLLEQLTADINALKAKLPAELLQDLEEGTLKDALNGQYESLLGDVGPVLVARIVKEEN